MAYAAGVTMEMEVVEGEGKSDNFLNVVMPSRVSSFYNPDISITNG
jgi:hypothetical protein